MKDKNTIYFSLPGYYMKYNLNMALLDMFYKEREKFYDNIEIDSFYDSFPCIWNGGRAIYGSTNYKNIINTTKAYNDKGISIRHTFTNSLIEPHHLNDHLGNLICKLTEHPLNGVNVNRQIMAEYIKQNYPKFYMLWSTTLGITDVDKINEMSKDTLTVIDYSLNNKFDDLKRLEHPENIEILVAEACVDGCPKRRNHYTALNKVQMLIGDDDFVGVDGCLPNWDYYNFITNKKHYISIEDINEKYLPMGLNQFKISGRASSNVNTIERYVNYLVKPEYKDEIRNRLLIAVYK